MEGEKSSTFHPLMSGESHKVGDEQINHKKGSMKRRILFTGFIYVIYVFHVSMSI